MFCNELMWPGSLFPTLPLRPGSCGISATGATNKTPALPTGTRGGAQTYTWGTIVPAKLKKGNQNRQNDHLRWMNQMTQPRLAQLGALVKSIDSAATLGWHDVFNQYYGDVSDPSTSPLATTDKFDFVSTNAYGGLKAVKGNLSRILQFYPTLPAFIGELGTRTGPIAGYPQYPNGDEPAKCKDYLDSQKVGYNWWAWQELAGGSPMRKVSVSSTR